MTKYWNKIKEKFVNENGIVSIGISDIIGSGLSGIFWLYIASVIDPGDYGEIHYFLGIAGMAQIFSMFGNPHALTVYSAKNENIQSTLFLLSIIPTIVSSIIIFIIFTRFDTALLVIGYVIFESVNSVILGRKICQKYLNSEIAYNNFRNYLFLCIWTKWNNFCIGFNVHSTFNNFCERI